MDTRANNISELMIPLWTGNTVYDESVVIILHGNDAEKQVSQLLFNPTKIISVTNAAKTAIYEDGKDFAICENGIEFLPGSRMPHWGAGEFHSHIWTEERHGMHKDGGFIPAGDGVMYPHEIAVTYEHSGVWSGFIPEFAKKKLPLSIEKLENNKPMKILYFGDSIAVGYASSGQINVAPFLPPWPVLAHEQLKSAYNLTDCEYINTAAGGMATNWLSEENVVKSRITDYAPDLVVMAFGMNDHSTPIKEVTPERSSRKEADGSLPAYL